MENLVSELKKQAEDFEKVLDALPQDYKTEQEYKVVHALVANHIQNVRLISGAWEIKQTRKQVEQKYRV